VVVQTRSAVAAKDARREPFALVALDQILTLGDREIVLVDYDNRQTRTRPTLAACAMAVAQRLRITHFILDSPAQTSSLKHFSHHSPPWSDVRHAHELTTEERAGIDDACRPRPCRLFVAGCRLRADSMSRRSVYSTHGRAWLSVAPSSPLRTRGMTS